MTLNLARDTFMEILQIGPDQSLLYWGMTLMIAFLFLLPAYKTMKWIAYVDYLAVPAIVIVLIVTLWGALDLGGGLQEIIKKSPLASASAWVVFNPAAFTAWIVGFLIGYFTQEFFISLLNGMFVTGLVYYFWMSWATGKGTTPERQVKELFS